MAVGRISGPLLQQNLFRDNIPLAFYNTSSSSENPVLYLDVSDGLVGIQTSAPAYTLDVAGTINAQVLRVVQTTTGTGIATIGNFSISSNTITTTVGPVIIAPTALEPTLINSELDVTGVVYVYNTETSTSTTSGAVQIAGGVGISDNLYVAGIGSFNTLTALTETLTGGIQSTGTDTGTLVVEGGVGISGNLNVGGDTVFKDLTILSTLTTLNLVVTGTETINVSNINSATIGGAVIGTLVVTGTETAQVLNVVTTVTTMDLVVTGTAYINNLIVTNTSVLNVVTASSLTLTSTLNSTGTDTGALIVAGGAGIGQDLWVGGYIYGNISTSTLSKISFTASVFTVINTLTGIIYPVLGSTSTGHATPGTNLQLYFDTASGTLTSPALNLTGLIQSTGTDSGTLVIAGGAGISGSVNIGSTVTVGGDLLAAANVTLGSTSTTGTITVNSPITGDLIPISSSTYNIGNSFETWNNGYFQKIYATSLTSQNGPISLNPEGGYVEVNGNIKVNGTNPVGTAPVVTNVLYVTMDGDDTNDGRAMDPSRACRTIGGAIKSPYYAPGTSIKVSPGRYYENNPLLLQPYTSIIGSDLRTTSIEPINKTQDLFHLQSGCYLAQMQFLNGRSGLLPGTYANGYNRGAYATAFPPNGDANGNPIDVYHSPYIQNCTNQSGPWLNDGTLFIPNQTVQIPDAVGTASWDANTTTITVAVTTGTIVTGQSINGGQQDPGFFSARTLLLANQPFIQEQVVAYVNQTYPGFVYNQALCYRDVGIIVQNLSYDATFGGNQKSIESGLAYWNGVTSVIAGQETETTAAISYINTIAQQIINNTTATNLLGSSSTHHQVINTAMVGGSVAGASITTNVATINGIILNGPSIAPTEYISSGPDSDFLSAEVLLQLNRSFIQSDTLAWIANSYPTFVYNTATCYRDIGLIVDAVSQDIILGGNRKTLEAAFSYWQGGYDQIVGEKNTTTAAISHARDISLNIINNSVVTPQAGNASTQTINTYFSGGIVATSAVRRNFDIITNIITNGTAVAPPFFQGFGVFAPTGLTGDDVKIATTITSVTNLGGNSYSLTLSSPTVSSSTNMFLYFGTTYVYPLQNNQVPDQWAQRRVDPLGSMGGSLVDGGVVSKRSPIQSFVYDAYTQVNQGGRGIHIINNGYAQLVSVFTIFCSTAVEVDTGGIASITNSNSNFGDYCLVAKSYGKREFSGTVYNPGSPYFITNGQYYPNGYFPTSAGQVLVYVPDSANRPHIALIMEVEPPTGHINTLGLPGFLEGNFNTGTLTTGSITISGIPTDSISQVAIGQTVYVVDQYGSFFDSNGVIYCAAGTVVTDVGYQTLTLNKALTSGGGTSSNPNYFNVYTCGNAYYTVLSSTVYPNPVPVGDSLIPGISGQELTALKFINTLTQRVISNTTGLNYSTLTQTILSGVASGSGSNSFINTFFSTIETIVQNGVNSAPSVVSSGNPPSGAGNAITLIENNVEYITQETISYINSLHPSINYNRAKCERDIGLIVEALAQDLLFGGTSQSTFAGIQYWNQTSTTIPNEVSTTTAAINYLSYLAQQVVQNITTGTRYQTVLSQVTNLSTATGSEAGIIAADFNIITGILTNGTAGVTDAIIPNNLTSSTSVTVQNAFALLQANKSYFAAEVVAFVQNMYNFTYNPTICSRDTGLIVDSLAFDLLYPTPSNSQTTFAGIQYWNQTGYTGSIGSEITTTTQAITYLSTLAQSIVLNITSGARYQSTVHQTTSSNVGTSAEATIVSNEFTTILNILQNGTTGVTGSIISNGSSSTSITVNNSYNLLVKNISYMQAEVLAYVNTITSGTGFTYTTSTCQRDVGYIVNSVAFDLLHPYNSSTPANRQAIQSGVYYYGYNSTSTTIPYESVQVNAAYNHLSDIVTNIVVGTVVTPTTGNTTPQVTGLPVATTTEAVALKANISNLINIINNGPGVVTAKTPISLTQSNSVNVKNAFNILEANRAFIQAELIAFINKTFVTGFTYNQSTCQRDVGYIIDSVSFDLAYGGNRQSIQSGVYYYGYSTTVTAIANEIPQTTAAYEYLRQLVPYIVKGITTSTIYQYGVSQVIPGALGTNAQVSTIQNDVDNIVNIIQNGPGVVSNKLPITLTASTDPNVINAANALINNISFLKAELTAYIDSYYDLGTMQDKCARDVRLILQQLVYDLETGGNYNSVYSGLSYWSREGTYHLVNLEESVTDPALFPDGATINFYQRSYISASGYLFEYVGAGTNYGALPQWGIADPVQEQEVIMLDGGKVFYTSTDQNGDFRIGPGLVISQATGVLSGRTFTKSLFANLTPFILAIEAG